MRRLPLVLPPTAEQQSIVAALWVFDNRIDLEGEALRKLRLLKQGLMKDLLTGRVRVTKLLQDAAE
jgi:type I restriction enzyme S subunit